MWHRLILAKTLAVSTLLLSAAAHAQTCSSLPDLLDDVRTASRQITDGADLASNKDLVKPVRAGITIAATAALNCRCNRMYTELLSSAAFARQAEDANTPKEFMDYFNRSIFSYNTALTLMRNCP